MKEILEKDKDIARVLTAAIEIGRELAGIERFGYPSIGSKLETAVGELHPYSQALKVAVEPYAGRSWIIELLQTES